MKSVDKTVKKWLNYEEILLAITAIIAGVTWKVASWADPHYSLLGSYFYSAGLRKTVPKPFTPEPYVYVTLAHIKAIAIACLHYGLIILTLYLIWRFIWRQKVKRSIKPMRIILSRDDLAAPLTVGATFDSWAQTLQTRYMRLLLGNYPLSLIIAKQHTVAGRKGEIVLLMRAPERFMGMLAQRLQATWTSVRIEPYSEDITFGNMPVTAVFRPQRDTSIFGFRTYRDYNHSITESIVQVIDSVDEDTVMEIMLKPLPSRYELKAMKKMRRKEYLHGEDTYYNPADPGMGLLDQAQLQAVGKTAGRSWYRTEIRVAAPNLAVLQAIGGALAEASAENAFEYHRTWVRQPWQLRLMKAGLPGFFPFWREFALNGIFLSTIWQLPSARLRTPGLTRASTRRGPGAIGLDREVGGCTLIEDESGPIVLKEDDRKSGVLSIGQQGTGKSTVLEQIAHYDFRADKAVIVLDPKGQMADRLRDFVPEGRKVATWKLSQAETLNWGWNPFLQDIDKSVLISGVIASMKQVWGPEAIGPRSSDYLRLAMDYVLQTGRAAEGFVAVDEFLEHPEIWDSAAQVTQQPLAGWLRSEADRFASNEKFFTESLAAPKNKLREFLFYPKVRENLIPNQSIDLAKVIRDKGILIVSLEPGDNLHQQNSDLIATMLVTNIWDTIRRNGSLLNNVRTSLILDEAHRMVCDSLSNAMAEGRSYGLQLSVGLQFLTQIKDETLRDSITELLQNLFLFRSSLIKETEDYSKLFSRIYTNMIGPDAEIQDKLQFGPDDRFNLPQYQALCRMVVDGAPKPAFLGKTIPLFPSAERDIKLPWGTCPSEWLLGEESPIIIQAPVVETVVESLHVVKNINLQDLEKASQKMEQEVKIEQVKIEQVKQAEQVELVEQVVQVDQVDQVTQLEQVKVVELVETVESETEALKKLSVEIGLEDSNYQRLKTLYGIEILNEALKVATKKGKKLAKGKEVNFIEAVCKKSQMKIIENGA